MKNELFGFVKPDLTFKELTMNGIIEKLYTGEPISVEEFEILLPNYIVLKETFETAVHEYRSSIPNSQRKAFDTVIRSQRDLFGVELKQAYANGFKTGARLMLEICSQNEG